VVVAAVAVAAVVVAMLVVVAPVADRQSSTGSEIGSPPGAESSANLFARSASFLTATRASGTLSQWRLQQRQLARLILRNAISKHTNAAEDSGV
jgi:hypothetical protein